MTKTDKKKTHTTSGKMKNDILDASYPRENDRLLTKVLGKIAIFRIFFKIRSFLKVSCP